MYEPIQALASAPERGHRRAMIFIVVTGFTILMALRVPWRSLTRPVLAWVLASIANTAFGVIFPTTFATSVPHLRAEQITNLGYIASNEPPDDRIFPHP